MFLKAEVKVSGKTAKQMDPIIVFRVITIFTTCYYLSRTADGSSLDLFYVIGYEGKVYGDSTNTITNATLPYLSGVNELIPNFYQGQQPTTAYLGIQPFGFVLGPMRGNEPSITWIFTQLPFIGEQPPNITFTSAQGGLCAVVSNNSCIPDQFAHFCDTGSLCKGPGACSALGKCYYPNPQPCPTPGHICNDLGLCVPGPGQALPPEDLRYHQLRYPP